jgi:hypothetical protein
MSDEATPGVLLRSADGNHFFIPHTDLSKYAVDASADTGGEVAAGAPRVDAFAVQRPEGAAEAAAFMPMPEDNAAAYMPMPEG